MFFSDKSELISLSFVPRNKCFSKAQIEWRGIVLNGKVSANKPIVDLSNEDLNDLIFELFGKLSFIEVSELFEAVESSELARSISWEEYFKKIEMHYNQRNKELFLKVNTLPEVFKNWCFERKLSASDLMPIASLNNFEIFNSLSALFDELNCSRNDGKKIIDILVDLILMGKTKKDLIPMECQVWLKHLSEIRYPETTKTDYQSSQKNVWPEFVQVQNKRMGDKLTYNMQIQYTDQYDLNQKLNRLSQISEN